ncbi:MAG: class I SAM-dependent methyltransferase [Candidatus Aureabacteria bacterium]|nr:class I SAM-dependent methyltransferase [Candidatus Auribacterota bacterium]
MKHESDNIKKTTVPCPLCGATAYEPWARGPDFEHYTSHDEFTFVRCRHCGLLYLNPRPELSELHRIYPPHYRSYHFEKPVMTFKVRSFLERYKVRLLNRLLPDKADIVDVGCGGPGFLERLRRHGRPGWRLWGNDINPEILAELEKRGFLPLPGRFEELDRPAGSFDAIFFKQVLEHFESPRTALVQAARLLRQNGIVVIETPNIDAWDARLFKKRYWSGYHIPRHWTLFDPRTIERLAGEAGLRIETISFLSSPCFWVESLHHILIDKGWPPLLYNRFTHRNPLALAFASFLDTLQKLFSGKTSNMRVILRKESP